MLTSTIKNIDIPLSEEEMHILWAEAYDENNYVKPSLSTRVLLNTHALLERDFSPDKSFANVLEVGAGSGVHFGFVRHKFDRYVMCDASQKILDSIEVPKEFEQKVETSVVDATALPYEDDSFDRLIATHVLEHIPSPHKVLLEWARVVKPGGVLSLIIPCDPGLLWRLGRKLGPRRAGERAGLPYDYYMATEHINSVQNLTTIIESLFPVRKTRWWPIPFFRFCDANLIYSTNISL